MRRLLVAFAAAAIVSVPIAADAKPAPRYTVTAELESTYLTLTGKAPGKHVRWALATVDENGTYGMLQGGRVRVRDGRYSKTVATAWPAVSGPLKVLIFHRDDDGDSIVADTDVTAYRV